MQNVIVDHWVPKNRWDTPSRVQVNNLLEAEWLSWIANTGHKIKSEGMMYDFKTEET
jgi:hypothetical protein